MRNSNAIAKVIESCLDDERTLVHQSKLVDKQKSDVLTRLASERRRFSEELGRLSHRPISRGHLGSWNAIAKELGETLWSRLWGHNAGDAVAACRRSQHRADVRYEKALELEWPADMMAALKAQHERVHAAQHELATIEYRA